MQRIRLLTYLSVFIVLNILLVSCDKTSKTNENPKTESSILGSWEMTSIHWITKDTSYTIAKAQPGLLIITPTSYSIMWTPTAEPRIPFKLLSKPTDEELKSGFRSIVFNAGTHQLTDSTLTTKAMVAKVPGFEGGTQFYRYSMESGNLELTMFDETYPDGTKPAWFGEYETKFVLKKLK